MKHVKLFENFLTEKKEEKELTLVQYEVLAKDDNKTLKKVLDCIKSVGNAGHTFSIVIDPEGEDADQRTFEWDGDGSDMIRNVKATDVEDEEEEKPAEEEKEEEKAEETPAEEVPAAEE